MPVWRGRQGVPSGGESITPRRPDATQGRERVMVFVLFKVFTEFTGVTLVSKIM